MSISNDYPIVFAKNEHEFKYLLEACLRLGFLDEKDHRWALTVKGYEKAEELRERNPHSKYCFVAMDFDPSFDQVYKQGIEAALKEKSFEPVYLKTKEHNNLIDDDCDNDTGV